MKLHLVFEKTIPIYTTAKKTHTQVEDAKHFSPDDTVIVTEGADPADGEGVLSMPDYKHLLLVFSL